MPDAREMHADLMRAAGADPDLKESEPVEAAQDAVLGPGGAAFGESSGHARASDGVARDGALDPSGVLFDVAVHQGEIDLAHQAAGELFREAMVRSVVLRYQEDAAGESVEAVDDAGPQRAADAGQRAETVKQRVDERSRVDAGAGVHNHAGGLVDGD